MTTLTSTHENSRPRVGTKMRIFAISLGNALEWYDWTVFGLFAIYFAPRFFPAGNDTLAMLNTYATFALAFFFRPLGGLVLGRLADVKGRRVALLFSVSLMAAGSITIGLLPTFGAIGWAAPLLLLLARIAQGLSVGGEAANSYAYLAEIAPADRRARYGSFCQISTAASVLLASVTAFGLSRTVSADFMKEYGWRLPFLIGGVLGLIVLWLRRNLSETELFEEHREASVRIKHPLITSVRRKPLAVIQVVSITALSTLCFYIFFAAMVPFATKSRGADPTDVFATLSIATLIFVGLQYPAAWLADKLGRRPVVIIAAAAMAIAIVPLSTLVSASVPRLFIAFMVGLTIYSLILSILPALMSELFPTELRALGIGAWYNLASGIFGGTAALILTALSAAGHSTAFFWYVAGIAGVAFLVGFTLPETKGRELT